MINSLKSYNKLPSVEPVLISVSSSVANESASASPRLNNILDEIVIGRRAQLQTYLTALTKNEEVKANLNFLAFLQFDRPAFVGHKLTNKVADFRKCDILTDCLPAGKNPKGSPSPPFDSSHPASPARRTKIVEENVSFDYEDATAEVEDESNQLSSWVDSQLHAISKYNSGDEKESPYDIIECISKHVDKFVACIGKVNSCVGHVTPRSEMLCRLRAP
jgi:hypothetical protein